MSVRMLCTFKILLIVLVLASSGLIQRDQPREFTAVLQRLGMPQQHLLIPCESHTVFTTIHFTRENYAVPSTQGWSRCQYCGLRDDERVVMFNANGELHKSVLLSWSLWGEFFHKHKNDRIEAIYDENFEAYYRIDRPVFVLPLITLHVGHILVDLLEQLYHAHMEHYGEIRKDCVIILDVASESERAVLREKIYYSINSDNRSVGALLRQFTDLPIFSIDLWKELSTWNNIVFSDLHVGLDISLSHFNAGQHSQPCIMSLTHVSTANFALVQRYQKFARFLRQSVDFAAETDTKHETVQVTMIQRKKNRVINNIEDILRVSQRPGLATAICDLDTMDYQQQQRTLLWNTDILVSVAGTALHNVLFMRPGSAVVMFMQPHWCEYAWMFANQAVLLGIKPFVYCTPASPVFVVDNSLTNFLAKDIKLASWTRQMWLQGPRHYKSDNVTVGLSEYAILLDQAVAHVREQIKSAPNLFKKEDFRTGEPHNAARSLQALSCPFPIEKKPTKTGKLTGNVESSTGAEQHGSNFPARRMHRALEIYISSLTAEYVPASVGWKVGIVGEVGIADAQFSALLESLPRLAICMESVDMAPWCHPVAAFNYYTDLFLTMEAPVQALHVWAQATSSGAKLRHSDVYVVLDCRLPEAGFALHREIVGSDISFEVTLSEDCVPSNVRAAGGLGALRAQVLTYPTSKFGTTKQSCRTSRRLLFQNKMHSRLSLQRFTADFCWLHALTAANCVDFITHLQQHILRVRAAAARGLPPVQHEPSPVNPFHFLHIEKTAGSTLREYISAAVDDRHLSAFIPCHTEHCAVFAPPVHRPNTLQETSSDSTCDTAGRVADAFLDNDAPTAAINAETLDDLRLIQPPNRDNSNLSVLAGHFDFYAPYRALPQCMQPVTTVPSFTNTNRSSDTDPARGRWSKHVLATVDPHNPAVSDAPPPSPTCRVSCLTIGRHPVDRAISYYYQRFYQHPSKVTKKQPTGAPATGESSHSDQGGTPPVSASPGVPAEGKTSRPLNQHTINELTPAELELVALSTREGMTSHFYPDVQVFIDEGMADAACSALLGLKYTSGRPVGPIAIPPEIPAALYPRARTNLRQCVVGLQEQWNQTLQVLDHWFPWLDYSDNPTRKKMSIYSGLETRKTLRVELHDVLVALNPCDMMLYEEMQKIFAAQLEVLKLDAF